MRTNTAKTQVIFAQNHFNTIMNSSNINFDTKEDSLNDDYQALLTVKPEDNSLDFEQVKNFALENRADILRARQKVISATYNLNVIKSKLIPDIELEGGWGYETGSNSDTGNFESGAFLSANLKNIPLIYRYKPEIKNAQLEIEKAELTYEDTKIDAVRNITDAWEKYTIARDNLVFYNKELLADSNNLLKASKKSLDKNKSDVTSFLVAKKLYLELILGYQEALANYYTSYAELVRETNMPISL
ncbi:MAG: TolC family protein [Candidatus Gastranaerophilales bacterium]|nr:TolC family protein [Candidatus Gastranaerophilales bacterium]